jgi:hypothetical protein
MHQAFNRTVHHQRAGRQGRDHGRKVADGARCAGGSRDGLRAVKRRRQHQREHLRPDARRGQPGQRHQHRSALAFAQHGHGIAGLQCTTAQHGFKGINPRGFSYFLQHARVSDKEVVSIHNT